MNDLAILTPENGQKSSRFDYGQLDPDTAESVRAAAAEISKHKVKVGAGIIAIGNELLKVKAKLQHGLWQGWLEVECDIHIRTAQRFMQAATALGDKSDTVSFLPLSTIYHLAAPSIPEEARSSIIEKIETGELRAVDQVDKAIDLAKSEARKAKSKQQRQAEKRAPSKSTLRRRAKREAELEEARKEHQQRIEDAADRVVAELGQESLRLYFDAENEAAGDWYEFRNAVRRRLGGNYSP